MRRLLLIDDTLELAPYLTRALAEYGHEVVPSGYAWDVGDLVERTGVSAVILACSAFETSESIFDVLRSEPAHADLPVVIVTDTPEAAVAALEERAARHVLVVPKPFRASEVAAALEQLDDPSADAFATEE